MKTPILESERIVLRPLSLNDAEHIFKSWTSDPEVAKFMIWDQHQRVDDTIEWLKIEEENVDSEEHYTWGFVLKRLESYLVPGVSALIKSMIVSKWDITS